jgi:putative Mn2+ efflux pump MntP
MKKKILKSIKEKIFNTTRFFQGFLFACTIGLGSYLGDFFKEYPWYLALAIVTIIMMVIGGSFLDFLFPFENNKKTKK